jgi:CBS domain containing-hemolysin-like protein
MLGSYLSMGIFLISISLAALFAFLETSFTALRLFKVKELRATSSRYDLLLDLWEIAPQKILVTILIANNLAHVVSSVLMTELMQNWFGDLGLAVGIPIATVVILLFGEIFPKTFAKSRHGKIGVLALAIMYYSNKLLSPLVFLLIKISDFMLGRFSGKTQAQHDGAQFSESELKFLIEYGDRKGIIASEKSEMLHNVFELGQTMVREIMVPRVEVEMISLKEDIDKVVKIFLKEGFSRLPVYDGDEENIVGMVYQKDLFKYIYGENNLKNLSYKKIIRPVFLFRRLRQ